MSLKDRMQDFDKTYDMVIDSSHLDDNKSLKITKAPSSYEAWVKAAKPKYLTEKLDPIWDDKVEEFGQAALTEMGLDQAFDMMNPDINKHLEDFGTTQITGYVNETTQQALRDTLSEGVEAGEGISELSKRVGEVFDAADGYRAELIARTEVLRSSNFATLEGYKQSKLVDKKEWISTPDDRVRDTHAELGSRPPIEIDEDFEVDGLSAPAPGQFDDASEDCNCRCTIAPVVSDIDENAIDEGEKRAAYKTKLWKKFDKSALAWEDVAISALKKGFAEQRTAVLNVMRGQ